MHVHPRLAARCNSVEATNYLLLFLVNLVFTAHVNRLSSPTPIMDELKQQMEMILKGLDALKGAYDQVRHEPTTKLDHLERDVAAGQEETAQLVSSISRGNQLSHNSNGKGMKNSSFNAQISHSIQTAVGFLDKLKSNQPQAAAILKTAKESSWRKVHRPLKLICFVDHSQSVWGAVDEYPQEDITKDEKEAKKWADAEKSMEAKMRCKRSLDDRGHNDSDPNKHSQCQPPVHRPLLPQPLMSARAFGPLERTSAQGAQPLF